MDFRDLIKPEQVLIVPRANDKEQLLRDLAQRAASELKKDVAAILQPLLARESLGSTGLGQGFALPHARIEGIDSFFCLFAKLAKPVPFEAVDDKPVDLVFLLLIPANAGSDHLTALAAISRHLRDKTFMENLRKAKTPGALYSLIVEHV
ncbi:PTS sugar transporter subunit IIA [Methyloferula stellata]|uniref:PTS sugar transporter subunit IIA n=1 Tax=Methyloferula stellata TaxID=876270 RepID=UPI00036C1E72|nr:PTS sugar transporter subunit IIA [Methyloferula stellata]